jgi:hypothetical protein
MKGADRMVFALVSGRTHSGIGWRNDLSVWSFDTIHGEVIASSCSPEIDKNARLVTYMLVSVGEEWDDCPD